MKTYYTNTPRKTSNGPRHVGLVFEPLTKEEQKLVADNLSWAHYYVAYNFNSRKYIYNDLITVAYLALMRAAKTYKPDMGKFTTYSVYWLRNYVGRDIKWFWGAVEKNEVSGDKALFVARPVCSRDGPQESVIENEKTEALKKLIRKYMRVLTKKQRDVLRDVYLKGITVTQVARRESQSRQCIDERRKRALSVLRKKYNEPIDLR